MRVWNVTVYVFLIPKTGFYRIIKGYWCAKQVKLKKIRWIFQENKITADSSENEEENNPKPSNKSALDSSDEENEETAETSRKSSNKKKNIVDSSDEETSVTASNQKSNR